MKCAIVSFLHDPTPSSGVAKRVIAQARACRKEGVPIDFYAISEESIELFDESVHSIAIGRQSRTLEKNRREVEAICSIMAEYDGVCVRNMLYSHHYWSAFRNRPCKLVTEAHGKHLVERKKTSFKTYVYEAFFTPPCLAVNDALISMTPEIDSYLKSFMPWEKKPSCVIPNGIDVGNTPMTSFSPFSGKDLHVCMVAGIDAPWHGWERLAAGLKNYSGSAHITTHLVGDFYGQREERIGPNCAIRRHGSLHGNDLDELMGEMNLGIATLGLHRKGQRQACPLKTRDYLARGLPFVYGYEDVDIPNALPFCLHVPNDDSPIDFEELISFAKSVSGSPAETSASMRDWAQTNLDWTVKMRGYERFMSHVCTKHPNE